jgi:hypothetical protein
VVVVARFSTKELGWASHRGVLRDTVGHPIVVTQ